MKIISIRKLFHAIPEIYYRSGFAVLKKDNTVDILSDFTTPSPNIDVNNQYAMYYALGSNGIKFVKVKNMYDFESNNRIIPRSIEPSDSNDELTFLKNTFAELLSYTDVKRIAVDDFWDQYCAGMIVVPKEPQKEIGELN